MRRLFCYENVFEFNFDEEEACNIFYGIYPKRMLNVRGLTAGGISMIRKTLAALVIVWCAAGAASALPTVKITTADGNDPPAGTLVPGSAANNSPAFNFDYIEMSKFEITGAGNPNFNITRNTPRDSVRMRGNSTANVDMPKKPYRIKFGDRVGLFGKEPARSWVLLANHMDRTFAMTALALRLGEIVGLEFTNTSQFVNVEICGPSGTCTYKGIYQLTEQVQVNPGRVDISKRDGFLVEFNFHNPKDDAIYFTTGSNRYGLSVFIKSPEIDDIDYKGSSISLYPELAFVRDELNSILDTIANNARFQAGAHRKMIDITSYAKYVFIQQFIANFEWSQLGYLGSNFAYKSAGGKLKAGPIWDFDLSTGTLGFGSPTTYTFLSTSSSTLNVDPTANSAQQREARFAFYRRLFEDEVFRARYRIVWEENKSQIQALAAAGGFIDSIAGILRDHIAANHEPYRNFTAPPPNSPGCFVGCGIVGSGVSSVTLYDQEITRLKTWWNNRVSHWDTQISNSTNRTRFDASKNIPDEPTTSVTAARAKTISGGHVTVAGNSIKLNAADKASVSVFSLDGRVLRKVSLPAGNHTLRLGDMPKGVYMMRVAMDGQIRTLRVPVK